MENPKIRFKGFTKDWEQRKLSEITTMHARIGWQNLRTSEFLDSGDYMLITGTDFNDGAINYSTCHFVERERYEQDKHIQIKNGSILITKDGTLGKVAYVQGLSMPATLNAGVFNVEIKDETEVNDKYLFQYLKAPFLMDYVNKKATGGTIKHLNQNILVDFPVFMPSKAEQEEIGTYFEKLDNLITLHQRKCEQTKKLKKYMLQKMFPRNGAKVPEIRFYGFTYDWEQRKLGEVSESYSGGTPSVGNKSYYGGSIPFIRSAEINSESTELFLTEEGLTNSSARMVSKGDILYALYGATSGETGRSRINGAINQAILAILPHDGYDSEFLMQWLRKSKQNITDIYLQGGQGNLSGAIVKALEVNFPSLAEQRQIGNYFQSIDKLITLHQRKCDELKKMKKYMLQNMFI